MPNKEFALADIDLIFLDHDKLELTVTPRFDLCFLNPDVYT